MSISTGSRRASLCEKQLGEKWIVFTGDYEIINNCLQEKPDKSVWILLKFLNSVMRSFGQVIFANNPISGLLIMSGIAVADYRAWLAALMTSSLSFIFATLMHQDSLANLNGFYGYNAVLHGTVSVGLLPYLYDSIDPFATKFWVILVIAAILSVFVTSASANFFQHLGKFPIPCLTLPFNVLQFLLIFSLLNNSLSDQILSNDVTEVPVLKNLSLIKETPLPEILIPQKSESPLTLSLNSHGTPLLKERLENPRRKRKSHGRKSSAKETDGKGRRRIWERSVVESNVNVSEAAHCNCTTDLRWGNIFSGTIVAMSQVYGLNNFPCAVLMYLALIIYSPTTAAFSYLGSVLGTFIGFFFTVNVDDIYNGIWGYNGLLCAGALAGFCFVLTLRSAMLALSAVIFSTILQHFLTPVFVGFNAPLLTLPFNVTTLLFLLVTSGDDKALARPAQLTFPEKHKREYKKAKTENFEGYLRRARVSEVYASKSEV